MKEKAEDLKKVVSSELRKVVKDFSEKEGYLMLLEKRSLIVIDKWIDVTDEIINLYDNKVE